jgi:hypothetical protein
VDLIAEIDGERGLLRNVILSSEDVRVIGCKAE